MKSTFILLVLISLTTHAQVESDILTKSAEAIKQLKSIRYNITSVTPYETVTADFTIVRDRPYPLFGVAKVKVTGMGTSDHGSTQVRFASNGNVFQYYDAGQDKIVQIDEATDQKLFRTPISMYLLIPMFAYQEEVPFTNIISVLKSVKVLSDTTVFGEAAVKVQVDFNSKNFDGSPMVRTGWWYFRKRDNLVVGHVAGTSRRFLKIMELNKEYADAEFSLAETKVERITGMEPKSDGLLTIGSPAPDFTLTSPTLSEFTLSKNKSKVIVLDFWGTWCAPCIKAMPEIQKISDHFKDKDVLVIGVSVEPEPAAKPHEFMQKKGFTYPMLLGGTAITQPYRVQIFPTIYIIDKNGVILHAEYGIGREKFTEEIMETITKALRN